MNPTPTRLHNPAYTPHICPSCHIKLEYIPPASLLQCFSCSSIFNPTSERSFYSILNVPNDATPEKIKAAYRKLAAKIHPDKGGSDQDFQKLNEAYKILSDERKRSRYDRLGEAGIAQPDPSEVMTKIIGSEKFDPYIGELEITSQVAAAIDQYKPGQADDNELPAPSPSIRLNRIQKLAENLQARITSYHNDPSAFQESLLEELNDLKEEKFGIDLLHTIGYVYRIHSKLTQSWSFSSLGASISYRSRSISQSITTIKQAYNVKSAFENLQKAEQGRGDGVKTKEELEQIAAESAIKALLEGVKMEIMQVVGEVCQIVLRSAEDRRAIGVIAEIFESVKE